MRPLCTNVHFTNVSNGVEQPNTWLAVFSNWLRAPVTSLEFESAALPVWPVLAPYITQGCREPVPCRLEPQTTSERSDWVTTRQQKRPKLCTVRQQRERCAGINENVQSEFSRWGYMKYDVGCSMSPVQNKGFRALLFPNIFFEIQY